MSTDDFESFAALMERQGYSPQAPGGASPEEGAAYLLSPERAQRFELLMLLIANLGKPLALCGADGIGKSTFLGLLAERALDGWQVVSLRGDGATRQGDILGRIAQHAAMSTVSEFAVADYLGQLARNRQALVLLLDDAGKLAPGVLGSLWQFARDYPALRLVLALRPDEAHLKTATDSILLGECHFVDIPALTLPQCRVYLQRLAERPPRLLAPEDITPARARALYRASQGVPGRVVQLLAGAPTVAGARRSVLMLAVAALGGAALAAALVSAWYREPTVLPDAVRTPPESPVAQVDVPAVADRQPAAPSAAGEVVPTDGAMEHAPPPAEQPQPLAAAPSAPPSPSLSPTPATDAAAIVAPPPEPSAAATADVLPPPSPLAEVEQPSLPTPPAAAETPPASGTGAPPSAVAATPTPSSIPQPPAPAPVTAAAPTDHEELPTVDKSSPSRVTDSGSLAKKGELKIARGIQAKADKDNSGTKAGTASPARPVQFPVPSRWSARVAEPQAPLPLPPAPRLPSAPISPQAPAAVPAPVPAAGGVQVGPPAVPGEPPAAQAPLPAPAPLPATTEVVPRSDAKPSVGAPAIPVAPKDEVSVISQLWQSFTGGEPEAAPSTVRSRPQPPPPALPTASGDTAGAVAPPVPNAPEPESAAPNVPNLPAPAPANLASPAPVMQGSAEVPRAAASIVPGVAGLRDPGWLLAQPPQAYTLRVMSAREVASIKALLQRYPALQGQLVAFKTLLGASEWYPVYYGVFASEAEALRAAAQLPPALGKPMPRPLKLVHQEIRAAQR